MKKIFLILALILLSLYLPGQSLNEKIEKLDKIHSELDKKIEEIEQTEQKKQQTTQNIQKYLSQKKAIEAKIDNLEKIKKNAKSEYESTKNRLSDTRKTLIATQNYADVVNMVCQKEFNTLFKLHYNSVLYPENIADCKLLAYLLNESLQESSQINNELNSLLSAKQRLEKKKKNDEKYYLDVRWSEIVNKKKDKKYTKLVKDLEENLVQIETEHKQMLQAKTDLEKEAKALDELISKLQSEILQEDYSYEFSTAKLIWPLTGELIRRFGEQKSSDYNVTVFNNGIDICAKRGTDVKAVEDGVVAFAERHGGSGKLVIIDHRNGFYTLYGHNSVLLVSKGEEVFKGQNIALSGSTGTADQACLHFEIRKKGEPVDPLEFLNEDN
jgi:septal ring factor EnvC (AmiA/AmiB activator)